VFAPADEEKAVDAALQGLREVFGIAWLTSAIRLPHTPFTVQTEGEHLAELEKHLLEIAGARFVPNKTFAIRTKRADKAISLTSMQLDSRFGQMIRDKTNWKTVNLRAPDFTFEVEIRGEASFVFADRSRGASGLPVGTSGRVLTLLSGGIDSPVAAYLIARRGCRVDFIHFTASSISEEEARQDKIFRLAQQLSKYTVGSRLFLVPYTFFDFALLREKVEYDLVLFRRFMARVAEKLARRLRAQALVTGDNLSQVASQTLSNLVATSPATMMPILRPVLSHDKVEIIALAQQIGTYELSIEPYKDCCALITKHPRTASKHYELAEIEKRIFPDYDKLIDQTLDEAVCLEAKV
jgi:thiamine biosynthesis protein ThiI